MEKNPAVNWMADIPEYAAFEVGEFTTGNPVILYPDGVIKLRVGRFCAFAGGVTFLLNGNHSFKSVSSYGFNYKLTLGIDPDEYSRMLAGNVQAKGDIVVENDVFIGHESLILHGVRIGNGAVVGARSVVSRDIPPYAIAVGNPAQIVKYRFEPEVIQALQEIAWWDWPVERIISELPFMLGDVPGFIERNRR